LAASRQTAGSAQGFSTQGDACYIRHCAPEKSMTSLAIRIQELDDDHLEEFIDLWATQKSQQYLTVERVGGANDKGRDVIGFLSRRRHEGPARSKTYPIRAPRFSRRRSKASI
jgi:hypothetical protein